MPLSSPSPVFLRGLMAWSPEAVWQWENRPVERVSIVAFLDKLREDLVLRFLDAIWSFSDSWSTPHGEFFVTASYLNILSAKGSLPGLMAYAVSHYQGNPERLAQLEVDSFRWGRWRDDTGHIHLGVIGCAGWTSPSVSGWATAIVEALKVAPSFVAEHNRQIFMKSVTAWVDEQASRGKVTWKSFVDLSGEPWEDEIQEPHRRRLRFSEHLPIERIQAQINRAKMDVLRTQKTLEELPDSLATYLAETTFELNTDDLEPTVPPEADEENTPNHAVLLFPVTPFGNTEQRQLSEHMEQGLLSVPLVCWPTKARILTSLREEFPWAIEALERIEMLMAFWQKMGPGIVRFPPLLLVGEAGCGKTRLAQRLGEYTGLPNITIPAVGGAAQAIQGTERHWTNTSPSPIVRLISERGFANPLVIVDEIDKQAMDNRAGTLQDALLPLLEPENARRFRDPFLEQACDLSEVNWILTANDATALTGALRSRLEIVHVGHPQNEHLNAIAQRTRLDLARRVRCSPEALPWGPHDERWVRNKMQGIFTAREARRWVEQRLMENAIKGETPLTVVEGSLDGLGPGRSFLSRETVRPDPPATGAVLQFPRPEQ